MDFSFPYAPAIVSADHSKMADLEWVSKGKREKGKIKVLLEAKILLAIY